MGQRGQCVGRVNSQAATRLTLPLCMAPVFFRAVKRWGGEGGGALQAATRRTVKFCRAVFIFAVSWSFGTMASPRGRSRFSAWFMQRMQQAGVSTFGLPDSVPLPSTDGAGNCDVSLWQFRVAHESLDLRLVTIWHLLANTSLPACLRE